MSMSSDPMSEPVSERRSEGQIIEVLAFARAGASLQGEWPLSRMPRLKASLASVDPGAGAGWTASGSLLPVVGGEAQVWLHVQGRARVALECQRCLQELQEDISVDRRFRFVHGEAEAARLDEESEDDVLALPPRLDLMELLEDELILGLPIVPRHDVCPAPLLAATAPDAEDEQAPHPFAALAALRRGEPPSGVN